MSKEVTSLSPEPVTGFIFLRKWFHLSDCHLLNWSCICRGQRPNLILRFTLALDGVKLLVLATITKRWSTFLRCAPPPDTRKCSGAFPQKLQL